MRIDVAVRQLNERRLASVLIATDRDHLGFDVVVFDVGSVAAGIDFFEVHGRIAVFEDRPRNCRECELLQDIDVVLDVLRQLGVLDLI